MTSKIPNDAHFNVIGQIGQSFIRPEEKKLASTGRALANASTLTTVPFGLAGAAVGGLAAKLLGGEIARGARAGSLIGGAIGAVVTLVPLIGLVATAAFLKIRGVRQDPKSEPEKLTSSVDLLNKTGKTPAPFSTPVFRPPIKT